MTDKPPATLSNEWLLACASKAQILVPHHIQTLFEIIKPITDIAIAEFRENTKPAFKADNSASSNADVEIENLIKTHLTEAYPDYYFVGEEQGSNTPEAHKNNDKRWLVDPVDGTRNNAYGRPDVCLSVALQEFKDGQWHTQDALLVSPFHGEIIWASAGHKTCLLQYNPLTHPEPVLTPLTAKENAEAKPLQQIMVDLSTKPFPPAQESALIEHLRDNRITHRTTGSAALALANVATKKSDGAIVLAHDYDVAAGTYIAEQTGNFSTSHIVEIRGKPLTLVVTGQDNETHNALTNFCRSLTP